MRLLSKQGVEAAIQNPVRNTTRNNEAALNRMLPTGDTAFVQGGFDAFLRRDGRNLVAPMERMRPENFVLHGTDAYGMCSSLADFPESDQEAAAQAGAGRAAESSGSMCAHSSASLLCNVVAPDPAARVGVSLSSK